MPSLKKSLSLIGGAIAFSFSALIAQDVAPSANPTPEETPPTGFTLFPTPAPSPTSPDTSSPSSPATTSPSAPSANEVPLPEPAATPIGSNDSLFVQPPPSATVPGASSIPDLLPGTATGSQPVIRKSTTSSSLAELQAKIRLRQASTRAANEPALQQQLAYAKAQPTQPEFRAEMIKYYKLLQDREIKIDPTVKELAVATFRIQTQLVTQKRVRTTSAAEVRAARAANSTQR